VLLNYCKRRRKVEQIIFISVILMVFCRCNRTSKSVCSSGRISSFRILELSAGWISRGGVRFVGTIPVCPFFSCILFCFVGLEYFKKLKITQYGHRRIFKESFVLLPSCHPEVISPEGMKEQVSVSA
jgi:hypothetical protein